jgi:hypothetical protein
LQSFPIDDFLMGFDFNYTSPEADRKTPKIPRQGLDASENVTSPHIYRHIIQMQEHDCHMPDKRNDIKNYTYAIGLSPIYPENSVSAIVD